MKNTPKNRHHAALKPSFRASVQSDTLEMLVYEEIGENYWSGGGITAKTVKQALDGAGVFNSISIRINSPGGDAFEGVAILNLLRAQGKPVDVFIDGIAASAASVIAMAGDTITMGLSAMMMIHNAWTVCAGDGDDMRKCADTLDKISASVGEAYISKTGKTSAEIKTLMDEETWMGAQECIDSGFATALAEEDTAEDAAAMALARSFKALSKLRHVPESLKTETPKSDSADGCICPCGPCAEGNCDGCNCTDPACASCTGTLCGCGAVAQDSNLTQYEARLAMLGR